MQREKLDHAAIVKRLERLNGWRSDDDKLKKRFEFKDFAGSLAFVDSVGVLAEAADHHPDVHLGWGYAEFELTTHDRGGITEFDFDLAEKIESLAQD